MEGSLVAYKVFTNGSVLQASEVNENLMQQAVATFSNSAARTAAITSPVEGQLTYLLDVDRYEHWTGSSWVSPFGMTLINRTSFSAATVVTIDNLFTTSYDNYSLIIDATGSADAGIQSQLRKGGVDTATAYFIAYMGLTSTGSTSGNSGANLTNFQAGVSQPSSRWSTSKFDIYNPKNVKQTTGNVAYNFFDGTNLIARSGSMLQNSTTDFDGIRFFPTSGNITGSITVYGIRK
jgi:hypothetical protein